ncbi:hypothetical protein Y034_5799 [Burkholderia pseudomallei MSHR449]|nr:hypothetical protein Y034_5799 [Burkholderia pseudomallei MSHR449]
MRVSLPHCLIDHRISPRVKRLMVAGFQCGVDGVLPAQASWGMLLRPSTATGISPMTVTRRITRVASP